MPEALKLIRHNAGRVNQPDDPSMPFILDASFRPPSLMTVAFVMMHGGSETLRVRGQTREAIVGFVKANDLARHSRLYRLTISEEVEGKAAILVEVTAGKTPIPPELLKG